MNRLIPTPRRDKNGKVVVRHIKGQAPPPLGKAIPSPSTQRLQADDSTYPGNIETSRIKNPIARIAHSRERNHLIRKTSAALFSHGREVHRYTDEGMFRKDMGILLMRELEAASAVTDAATTDPVSDRVTDRDRSAIINAILRPTSDHDCGKRVLRLASQMSWITEHRGMIEELVQINDHLGYDQDTPVLTDDETLDSCIALLEHDFFQKEDLTQVQRRDFMLAALSNESQADQIAGYVLRRGYFDTDGFEEYVNTAKPLADGAL